MTVTPEVEFLTLAICLNKFDWNQLSSIHYSYKIVSFRVFLELVTLF